MNLADHILFGRTLRLPLRNRIAFGRPDDENRDVRNRTYTERRWVGVRRFVPFGPKVLIPLLSWHIHAAPATV